MDNGVRDTLRFEDLPALVNTLSRQINDLKALVKDVARPAPETPMGVNACAEWLSQIEGREVTLGAVYNRVAKQKIPYHKDGSRLIFFKSEIIEQCRQGGNDTLERQTDRYFKQA